jgi:hypothetical protein
MPIILPHPLEFVVYPFAEKGVKLRSNTVQEELYTWRTMSEQLRVQPWFIFK